MRLKKCPYRNCSEQALSPELALMHESYHHGEHGIRHAIIGGIADSFDMPFDEFTDLFKLMDNILGRKSFIEDVVIRLRVYTQQQTQETLETTIGTYPSDEDPILCQDDDDDVEKREITSSKEDLPDADIEDLLLTTQDEIEINPDMVSANIITW